MSFKEGDRVILVSKPPSEDYPNGLPQQHGIVDSVDVKSGTAIVTLDLKYREPEGDADGLREVPLDHIVKE